MTYDIVKVGIPIQRLNNEFISSVENVKNHKAIGIVTSTYSQKEFDAAPVGNDFLLSNLDLYPYNGKFLYGALNVLDFIWHPEWIKNDHDILKKRNLNAIVPKLISLFDEQSKIINFDKLYIFATGSPTCDDSITSLLYKERPDHFKIIETESSVDIAVNNINLPIDFDHRNYHYDFIIKNNKFIDINKLNVFTCLQNGYDIDNTPILNRFFNDMGQFFNDDDIFIAVNVGKSDCDVEVTTFGSARLNLDYYHYNPKSLIFALYKKELL